MPRFPRIRQFTTLLIAATASSATLAAAPAARASDPWAAVPAWPTACYSSQDKFPDQVNTARATVASERSRQDETNKSVAPSGAPEDPMAMAQRMQEAMMKDPQHAMAQMQAMGAADPAATQQRAMDSHQKYQTVKAADKNFMAQYQAARKAMLEPASTRMHALAKRANLQLVHTEAGDFWPEWAYKEAGGIMQEADRAYVPFCAQWFGTGGKVTAYLKQRKDYLVKERIPDILRDDPTVSAQQLMGHNAEGYRPIATFDVVDDYLVLANGLFELRTATASSCSSYMKCDDQFGLMNF